MINIPQHMSHEIIRVRERHSEEYLHEMYAVPHNHSRFGRDHHLRVEIAAMIGKNISKLCDFKTGADLSCGNGHILKSMDLEKIYLGDFAPGYEMCGPIEKTIDLIPNVDIFICSETLEHLDNPLEVLSKIRDKSKSLVLSTPIDAHGDPNPEHYWVWSRNGVEWIMSEAGWKMDSFTLLDTTVFGAIYKFGIWSCL